MGGRRVGGTGKDELSEREMGKKKKKKTGREGKAFIVGRATNKQTYMNRKKLRIFPPGLTLRSFSLFM